MDIQSFEDEVWNKAHASANEITLPSSDIDMETLSIFHELYSALYFFCMSLLLYILT